MTAPGRTSEPIVVEQKYTFREVESALDNLSQVDPRNVQQLYTSHQKIRALYHDLVQSQARTSFRAALAIALLGFLFLIFAIGFIITQQPPLIAYISLIGAVLSEFIAAIVFVLYNKTSDQLASYYKSLEEMERFLVANVFCEGLDDVNRQVARHDLINAMTASTSVTSKNKKKLARAVPTSSGGTNDAEKDVALKSVQVEPSGSDARWL